MRSGWLDAHIAVAAAAWDSDTGAAPPPRAVYSFDVLL